MKRWIGAVAVTFSTIAILVVGHFLFFQPPPPIDACEPSSNSLPERPKDHELRVTVEKVGQDSMGRHVVLLRATTENQLMPIFIGRSEAIAIASEMGGVHAQRPMTHDLLKSSIEMLGGRVLRIVVSDLRGGTFYARISVSRGDDSYTLDARPSDSIALALRCNAPILVRKDVFGKASIDLPDDKKQEKSDREVPFNQSVPREHDFRDTRGSAI